MSTCVHLNPTKMQCMWTGINWSQSGASYPLRQWCILHIYKFPYISSFSFFGFPPTLAIPSLCFGQAQHWGPCPSILAWALLLQHRRCLRSAAQAELIPRCLFCCWPCDLEWASCHSSPNTRWSLLLLPLCPQDHYVWPRLGWECFWVGNLEGALYKTIVIIIIIIIIIMISCFGFQYAFSTLVSLGCWGMYRDMARKY